MSNLQISTLDQLVLEIKFYSQQTALNMIEVGKRLIEAKKEVPHGEWGKWLTNEVDLSDRTAQYFMKAYETFGNTQNVAVLRPAQVYALLDSPEPIRKEIIENHKPEEMTGKQIKDLSHQLQAAERRAEEAEQKSSNIETRAKIAEHEAELQKGRADSLAKSRTILATTATDLEEENELLREENKKLYERPLTTVEVVKEVVPADYEQLKTANEILVNKLKTAGDPIIVETPVQVFPPDYERIKQENEQLKSQQSGLTPEQLRVANKNTRQSFERIENESEIANKIINALMSLQLVPMKDSAYTVRCYLEYSPGGIDDALMDCDKSIAILQSLKQAFISTTKLQVVKK